MAKKKKKKDKKQKRKNPANYGKRELNRYVFDIFMRNPSKAYNYKQIAKRLGVSDTKTKQLIIEVLQKFTENEKLREIYRGKYKLKSKTGFITGTIDMTTRGAAYVISQEVEEDVFVSKPNMHQALHGDTVKVLLFPTRRKNHLEGQVEEIIERSKKQFVGTIQISKRYAFLVPDNSNMPYDIFIPLIEINGAKHNQKAIAEIMEWPQNAKNPIGKIIDVLGDPGDNDVEMHAILAEFDLPYQFTSQLDRIAEEIPHNLTDEEIKKRRDFRQITTFTIDPDDAKDFDDALSLQKVNGQNWEVGIHIADVSHYVKPDSMLDKEAYNRATSVYLVDRVVPMLPERLSNNICSLRPKEDKLTYSAVFQIDENGKVYDKWFGRTIICSDRRFTYNDVQKIIDTGEGDFASEIALLNQMAQNIRKQRFAQGAFNFERTEVKFNLDKNGKPIDVYFRESQPAHQLIEEFMLLANKKVAEFIATQNREDKKKVGVYRVHDKPDTDKLAAFSKFINKFGYKVKFQNRKNLSTQLNNLLVEIQGKSEKNIVEELAIRSMAKAEYSVENIGHYGLAFNYYTHFTSPIRRYPDIMVHRILDSYLNGKKLADAQSYAAKCKHTSEMERRAVFAERASVKYKQIEYMKDKLGQVFEGIISGVTEWGLYVEIVENKIEGMVSLKELDDDYYIYDEENFCVVGYHTKKKYQLGDPVTIQLIGADMKKKQLDFMIYDDSFYE